MEEGADQGDAVGASSRKLARSSSSGRHGRTGPRSCKACGVMRLPSGYNEKYRICKACYLAPQLCVDGEQLRFCQQCSKLQPLADFEGDRRSCRDALERHAERRQHRAARATACSASPPPQPRPARRPRLEQPEQQEPTGNRLEQPAQRKQQVQQQQQQQVKQEAVCAPSIHVAPAPPADPEPVQLWPAELLQLAQQEQQARQQREGPPPQLGGGLGPASLGPGSLSLVVGHPTERVDITMSLEPWLQSQPAPAPPCSEASSSGEPAVSAREAWKESLAALPARRTSSLQQAAPAAPATTRCSTQSTATLAAAGTTAAAMLPLPVPSRVAAPLLVPADTGSGCLSASLTALGSALMAAPTVARTPFTAFPDGPVMEISGSNSFKFAAGHAVLGAATLAPQLQPAALPAAQLTPAAAPTPQQLGWVRQAGPLPSSPMEALPPRGSSSWVGWL